MDNAGLDDAQAYKKAKENSLKELNSNPEQPFINKIKTFVLQQEVSKKDLQTSLFTNIKKYYEAQEQVIHLTQHVQINPAMNKDKDIYLHIAALYNNIYSDGINLYGSSKTELEDALKDGDPRKLFELLFTNKAMLRWQKNDMIKDDVTTLHITDHRFIQIQEDSEIKAEIYIDERLSGLPNANSHYKQFYESLKENILDKIKQIKINFEELPKTIAKAYNLEFGTKPPLLINSKSDYRKLDYLLPISHGNGLLQKDIAIENSGIVLPLSATVTNKVENKTTTIKYSGYRINTIEHKIILKKILNKVANQQNQGIPFSHELFYSYPYPTLEDKIFQENFGSYSVEPMLKITKANKYFYVGTNGLGTTWKDLLFVEGKRYRLVSMVLATVVKKDKSGGHYVAVWFNPLKAKAYDLVLDSISGVSLLSEYANNYNLSAQNLINQKGQIGLYVLVPPDPTDWPQKLNTDIFDIISITKSNLVRQNFNMCFINAGLNALWFLKDFTDAIKKGSNENILDQETFKNNVKYYEKLLKLPEDINNINDLKKALFLRPDWKFSNNSNTSITIKANRNPFKKPNDVNITYPSNKGLGLGTVLTKQILYNELLGVEKLNNINIRQRKPNGNLKDRLYLGDTLIDYYIKLLEYGKRPTIEMYPTITNENQLPNLYIRPYQLVQKIKELKEYEPYYQSPLKSGVIVFPLNFLSNINDNRYAKFEKQVWREYGSYFLIKKNNIDRNKYTELMHRMESLGSDYLKEIGYAEKDIKGEPIDKTYISINMNGNAKREVYKAFDPLLKIDHTRCKSLLIPCDNPRVHWWLFHVWWEKKGRSTVQFIVDSKTYIKKVDKYVGHIECYNHLGFVKEKDWVNIEKYLQKRMPEVEFKRSVSIKEIQKDGNSCGVYLCQMIKFICLEMSKAKIMEITKENKYKINSRFINELKTKLRTRFFGHKIDYYRYSMAYELLNNTIFPYKTN
tara:strand:+ start:31948 stop:34845 length:2898 start_codon:yes stop_codon:yes gene_type:complete